MPTNDFGWVQAAPFAAHVRKVAAETRTPWRVIAVAAEVPTRTVERIMSGRLRRLPESMARRLLKVDAQLLAQMGPTPVPAGAAAHTVARLRAAGVSWSRLAEAAQLSEFEVRRLLDPAGSSTAIVAMRLAALADELGVAYVETQGMAA